MEKTMKLTWSPSAYAKAVWMLARSQRLDQVEITGFGIAEDPKEPLRITDYKLIKAECSAGHIDIDDEAMANHVDDYLDIDIQPFQSSRIWCHTHPGPSAVPSADDWDTMDKHFNNCDFAVMFIMGTNLSTTCHISIKIGSGRLQESIPVAIDYSLPHRASNHGEWAKEYDECVLTKEVPTKPVIKRGGMTAMSLPYNALAGVRAQKKLESPHGSGVGNEKKRSTNAKPFKPATENSSTYEDNMKFISLIDGWYVWEEGQSTEEVDIMQRSIIQKRYDTRWEEANKKNEEEEHEKRMEMYDQIQEDQMDAMEGLIVNPTEAYRYFAENVVSSEEYSTILSDMSFEGINESYLLAMEEQDAMALSLIQEELESMQIGNNIL